MSSRAPVLGLLAVFWVGCGGGSDGDEPPGAATPLPYASEVVRFDPGAEAGFGEAKLPGVVLGPPKGPGLEAGSLDVLSLGKGGSIELGFEGDAIADVAGPDFVVFENAFWPSGDASAVFAEPGAVSVSEDGETWLEFPCDAEGDGAGRFEGCAGWSPTLAYDASRSVPLDPSLTGGDAFDLADVGISRALFVRVVDRSNAGEEPTAGFDLDAVGAVELLPAELAR
jgi:hypothetical protein